MKLLVFFALPPVDPEWIYDISQLYLTPSFRKFTNAFIENLQSALESFQELQAQRQTHIMRRAFNKRTRKKPPDFSLDQTASCLNPLHCGLAAIMCCFVPYDHKCNWNGGLFRDEAYSLMPIA